MQVTICHQQYQFKKKKTAQYSGRKRIIKGNCSESINMNQFIQN